MTVLLLRTFIRLGPVSLKHDWTDGTVKMASLPVPSVSDRRDTQTGPWKCSCSHVLCLTRLEHADGTMEKVRFSVLWAMKDATAAFVVVPRRQDLSSFLADLQLQWLWTQQHFQPVSDYVGAADRRCLTAAISSYILRGLALLAMHVLPIY